MTKNVSKKKKEGMIGLHEKIGFSEKLHFMQIQKKKKPAVLIGHPPLTYETIEKCKYVGPLAVRCPRTLKILVC